MISANSIKNFAMINTTLIFVGVCQQILIHQWRNHIIAVFLVFVSRNYFLLNFVEYGTQEKENINNDIAKIPTESYFGEFDVNVLRATAVEAATYMFIDLYIMRDAVSHSVFYDVVYFIPISFAFEICFDFFHYFAHRTLHHSSIYKYFHKKHHTFPHPVSITTFYQDPVDLLITNSLPTIISVGIIPYVSHHQFHFIIIYKNLIEISGHCGKNLNASSFTQCMWLAKFFKIELYTVDHDLHHSLNNCNYGKRFSLWDKIFGTYKK